MADGYKEFDDAEWKLGRSNNGTGGGGGAETLAFAPSKASGGNANSIKTADVSLNGAPHGTSLKQNGFDTTPQALKTTPAVSDPYGPPSESSERGLMPAKGHSRSSCCSRHWRLISAIALVALVAAIALGAGLGVALHRSSRTPLPLPAPAPAPDTAPSAASNATNINGIRHGQAAAGGSVTTAGTSAESSGGAFSTSAPAPGTAPDPGGASSTPAPAPGTAPDPGGASLTPASGPYSAPDPGGASSTPAPAPGPVIGLADNIAAIGHRNPLDGTNATNGLNGNHTP